MGCVRSRACIRLVSSADNTIARSGGFKYQATMFCTLSAKGGALDNLKVFRRCGRSLQALQIW